MQASLFGAAAPSFDAGLRNIRRIPLSRGAWLEHHPSWLEGHERVFDQLAQRIDWQRYRRMMYEREVDVPRLVARAPTEGPMAELLQGVARALAARYGRPFPSISLAYYRDGNDSVAFHGDELGRLVDDAIVATVSVGEPRRFLIKPQLTEPPFIQRRSIQPSSIQPGSIQPSSTQRRSIQPSSAAPSRSAGDSSCLGFNLGWGDLFVMGGTCQRTWQHAIPKRRHAHPRISIMFRPAVPER